MPDSTSSRMDVPRNWGDALTALPLETPPGDGWATLSSRLAPRAPARTPVRRSARWLAIAATLALTAALPLLVWRPAPDVEQQRAAVGEASPAAVVGRALPAGSSAVAPITDNAARRAVPALQTTATAQATELVATSTKQRQMRRPRVLRPALPHQNNKVETRLAAETTAQPITPTINDDAALATLHAESAQLEALVALARDDRVGNATAMVISASLDAQIGVIDAALSQPELSSTQRDALWQQRVAALRELAGIETTERVLAARGEQFDGALVAVD